MYVGVAWAIALEGEYIWWLTMWVDFMWVWIEYIPG